MFLKAKQAYETNKEKITMPLDWKHYPKEAGCYIGIKASNGNVALQAIEDALKVFDDIIIEFDANGTVEADHLPLYIETQLSDNGDGDQHSLIMHIWNAVEKDYPIKITPLAEFEPGMNVVHKETGEHFLIRTQVYYSVRQQWYYVVVPENDTTAPTQQLPEDILWTKEHFYLLIHKFNVSTIEVWKWDFKTNRVIKEGSNSRKMTPQDLVRQLQLINETKEVPF